MEAPENAAERNHGIEVRDGVGRLVWRRMENKHQQNARERQDKEKEEGGPSQTERIEEGCSLGGKALGV